MLHEKDTKKKNQKQNEPGFVQVPNVVICLMYTVLISLFLPRSNPFLSV